MNDFDLSAQDITGPKVYRNLAPAKLYMEAIRAESSTTMARSGALIAYSGAKTGRSPKDKRIVQNGESKQDIW